MRLFSAIYTHTGVFCNVCSDTLYMIVHMELFPLHAKVKHNNNDTQKHKITK
jgi:hypothetical protein